MLDSPSARPSPIPLFRAQTLVHPERSVRRGDIICVRRGVYAASSAWAALPPWDRYLVRVHATALALRGVVFSHESAAALLGLPVIGDPVTVHVLGDRLSTAGDRGGIRTHTTRELRQVLDLDGILATGPIECAVDLARLRHEAIGLAVADAVLRQNPDATVEMLVARNEARTNPRGRRTARWALHRADAAAESTLESVSRATIEWLGYPQPDLQHRFVGVFRDDRADFWWARERVVGEADGDLKYDGRFGRPLDALRGRRERDGRLRRAGARRIEHWTWEDVVDNSSLDAICRGAGLRRIRSVDTARLTGMRAALAPHTRIPARQHPRAETAG